MKKLMILLLVLSLLPLYACGSGETESKSESEASATQSEEQSTEESEEKIKVKDTIQSKESVVMIGTEWNSLRFKDVTKGTLSITDVSGSRVYIEGVDYEVDYLEGKIRRLEGSSIPDFSKNSAYGAEIKSLDLDKITDYSTYHVANFSVYARYRFDTPSNDTYDKVLSEINTNNATTFPEKVIEKIKNGDDIIIGIIGDSISEGCEATPGNEYFTLLANFLEKQGKGKVEVVNVAIGGRSSDSGVAQVQTLFDKLEGKTPDLITIAFGMNDQNSLTDVPWTSPEQFVKNIDATVKKIEALATELPEIMLITAMPANPIWNYTSGKWYELGDALREYAKENAYPIADAGALFQSELDHGQTYEELITALINHPGNYGHNLYYLALKSLFVFE